MDAEDTPNVLSDLVTQVQPADATLERIWRGLPDDAVKAEQARLRERFLDIAGRLVTINQVEGEQ